MKASNLTGQRFGRLVVIRREGSKRKKAAWLCQCDCGNTSIVTSDKLKSGRTRSCGCLSSETAKARKYDLTGHKYGRWTVIEPAENAGKDTRWKCRCECGTVKIIRSGSLRSGNSLSCGCFASEVTSERMKINHKPKPITDLTGKRFGKLVVLRMEEHIIGEKITWLCQCDCGNTRIVNGEYLRSGTTTHCGCNKPFSYRLTYPRIYSIWSNMKCRCNSVNDNRYYDYGGRGIKVCKEWNESFEAFCKWSLENGYEENLSIDRIDNNGNYEPSNCQWITMFDQMSNMRKNVNLTYKGETHTLSEWCRRLGFKYTTMTYRLNQGWSVEDAFETPIGKYERKK